MTAKHLPACVIPPYEHDGTDHRTTARPSLPFTLHSSPATSISLTPTASCRESSPSLRPLPWAPPSFSFVAFIHDCILAAWLLVALLLSTCTGCSLLPFVIPPSFSRPRVGHSTFFGRGESALSWKPSLRVDRSCLTQSQVAFDVFTTTYHRSRRTTTSIQRSRIYPPWSTVMAIMAMLPTISGG